MHLALKTVDARLYVLLYMYVLADRSFCKMNGQDETGKPVERKMFYTRNNLMISCLSSFFRFENPTF